MKIIKGKEKDFILQQQTREYISPTYYSGLYAGQPGAASDEGNSGTMLKGEEVAVIGLELVPVAARMAGLAKPEDAAVNWAPVPRRLRYHY